MIRRMMPVFAVLFVLCGVWRAQAASDAPAAPSNNAAKATGTPGAPAPNILFIILDDVGIDQMRVFGYGGLRRTRRP